MRILKEKRENDLVAGSLLAMVRSVDIFKVYIELHIYLKVGKLDLYKSESTTKLKQKF